MGENDEIFTRFKDYTVEYEELKIFGREAWAIKFRKPGGGNINSADFLWDRGSLHVSGDLGDATYCWYGNQPLAFFENISLDYFHSKCESSENGSRPHDWSMDVAKETFDDLVKDHGAEKKMEDLIVDYESPFQWNVWLWNHGCDVFDSDYCEYSGIGEVIPVRTKLHWAIIQLCARAIRDGVGTVQVEECPSTTA